MKTIFAITLVLLGANHIHATIIDKCWTEEQLGGEKYLEQLNEGRYEKARLYQIANMFSLKYDDGLATKARKVMNSCADLKHGSDYQLFQYGREESYKVWNEYVKKNTDKSFVSLTEWDHPLQTAFVKCNLTVKCTIDVYDMETGKHVPSEVSEITLFGHKGTLSLDDIKHGQPATECPTRAVDLRNCIFPPGAKEENDSESGKDGEGGEGSGGNQNNMASMVAVNSIFVYLSIWLIF